MNFSVLTLFPEVIENYVNTSILGRALKGGIIDINTVNIRDHAFDERKTTDDYTYGGGAGMLMKPDVVYSAFMSIPEEKRKNSRVIYMSPQGRRFTQSIAEELSKEESLIILCGHYEGIDERAAEMIVTDEISVGDYVLTGGEPAACIVIDAVSRLVDGVLNKSESYETETFSDGLCEYPQYTRPPEFMGKSVPEILLSGDHGRIEKWRREKALERTLAKRPDMLESAVLTKREREYIRREIGERVKSICDASSGTHSISREDILFLIENRSESVVKYMDAIVRCDVPKNMKILRLNDKLKSKCLLERKEKSKCESYDIFGNIVSRSAKRFRLNAENAAVKAKKLCESGGEFILLTCAAEEFFTDEILLNTVKAVKENADIPVAADFGIRDMYFVQRCLESGADMYAFSPFTISKRCFERIYRKDVTLEQYLGFYHELKNFDIPVCSVFMSSIPYETLDDILEDICFLISCRDECSFFVPFEPQPDTEYSDFSKGDELLCDMLNGILRIVAAEE